MKFLIELISKPITLLLFVYLLLCSFKFNDQKNIGYYSTETTALKRELRAIHDFKSIELKTKAIVYIQQGNTTKVEVIAPRNQLSLIETKTSFNSLIIDKTQEGELENDVEIYVTVLDLNKIKILGPGTIISNGSFNAKNLDLTVAG